MLPITVILAELCFWPNKCTIFPWNNVKIPEVDTCFAENTKKNLSNVFFVCHIHWCCLSFRFIYVIDENSHKAKRFHQLRCFYRYCNIMWTVYFSYYTLCVFLRSCRFFCYWPRLETHTHTHTQLHPTCMRIFVFQFAEPHKQPPVERIKSIDKSDRMWATRVIIVPMKFFQFFYLVKGGAFQVYFDVVFQWAFLNCRWRK